MRISDWSSDVCSSDLQRILRAAGLGDRRRVVVAILAGTGIMARASLNDRRHVELALLVVLRPTVVAVLVDRRLAVLTRLPALHRELRDLRAVFPLIAAGRVALTCVLYKCPVVFGTLLEADQ